MTLNLDLVKYLMSLAAESSACLFRRVAIHDHDLAGGAQIEGSPRLLVQEIGIEMLRPQQPDAMILDRELAMDLVGQPIAGLRRYVRDSLTGVPSCTHLNDLLRSLEDIVGLAALV